VNEEDPMADEKSGLQPAETEKSAGIAKLVGRPNASEPNEGLSYDASGGSIAEGKGVLDSQPATLNQ
jgi:hypothetical protein